MASFAPYDVQSDRLFPSSPSCTEQTVALSLLDATTAKFSATSAIWLYERPVHTSGSQLDLAEHLRLSLRVSLNAYPQWCGHLKSITTLNETTLPLAPHARRFGRVYVQYGTPNDPGMEFRTATSTATLDELYPISRPISQPLWNRGEVPLDVFLPASRLAYALHPVAVNDSGLLPPVLAIQLTYLACGGFILAVKGAHPLADITSLVHFMKDWGRVSQSILLGSAVPTPVLAPVFEPGRLDALAAGDIDATSPDPDVTQQVQTLPLHRYDWWVSSPGCPWSVKVPDVYHDQDLSPASKPMPWDEWDVKARVSHHVVHLNREQVESIWKKTTIGLVSNELISRHDAILAHIWSCIARARNLQDDPGSVHCDLVYGVRPALQLGSSFIGSPTLITNVGISGVDVAAGWKEDLFRPIAQRIRKIINQISQPTALAAHLHTLAYEKSPQRIWQTFLGRRHILVTTWARAGVYEIGFGLGESIRYVDEVVPNMDGVIVIKEGPPKKAQSDVSSGNESRRSWTDHGVDVSVHIRDQDMERLLKDPYLSP